MSFWSFIGEYAVFNLIRNRLRVRRESESHSFMQIGRYDYGSSSDCKAGTEELENHIRESKRKIEEYGSITTGPSPEAKLECEIDDLQDRIDRLESQLDECDILSDHYDRIQDRIDRLRDRLDDLEDQRDDLEDMEDDFEDIEDDFEDVEDDF